MALQTNYPESLEALATRQGMVLIRCRVSPSIRRYFLVRPGLGIRQAVETAERFTTLAEVARRLGHPMWLGGRRLTRAS